VSNLFWFIISTSASGSKSLLVASIGLSRSFALVRVSTLSSARHSAVRERLLFCDVVRLRFHGLYKPISYLQVQCGSHPFALARSLLTLCLSIFTPRANMKMDYTTTKLAVNITIMDQGYLHAHFRCN
jgi:hypothetical protein